MRYKKGSKEMKEYKGWELIKGIEDGNIKKGDKFTFINSKDIKHEIECDGKRMKYDDGAMVGYVSLVNGYDFRKVQKPLTFFEAIAKADEGKKVTNDCLEDENGVYKGYYFKYNNKLYFHNINDDMDVIFYMHENEIVSNWYIYEE